MNKEVTTYLRDYLDGKIAMGKDVGLLPLDEAIRYKQGQFNIINGLDNVGKTAWILWYFLCLSAKHDLRWCIWSGENKPGMLVRQLIEMYTGIHLKNMSEADIYKHQNQILYWFTFLDNSKFYTNQDLYKEFEKDNYHGCLIDPFTGLNRKFTHEGNYQFLNETRQFVNRTGKTVYLNTHPVSEFARRKHDKDHAFAGFTPPPGKADSEGGQSFANRCDDLITIHRYPDHESMWDQTLIFVRKVKDTETGGKVSFKDDPVSFSYNNGLGFTCGGINPLKQLR